MGRLNKLAPYLIAAATFALLGFLIVAVFLNRAAIADFKKTNTEERFSALAELQHDNTELTEQVKALAKRTRDLSRDNNRLLRRLFRIHDPDSFPSTEPNYTPDGTDNPPRNDKPKKPKDPKPKPTPTPCGIDPLCILEEQSP